MKKFSNLLLTALIILNVRMAVAQVVTGTTSVPPIWQFGLGGIEVFHSTDTRTGATLEYTCGWEAGRSGPLSTGGWGVGRRFAAASCPKISLPAHAPGLYFWVRATVTGPGLEFKDGRPRAEYFWSLGGTQVPVVWDEMQRGILIQVPCEDLEMDELMLDLHVRCVTGRHQEYVFFIRTRNSENWTQGDGILRLDAAEASFTRPSCLATSEWDVIQWLRERNGAPRVGTPGYDPYAVDAYGVRSLIAAPTVPYVSPMQIAAATPPTPPTTTTTTTTSKASPIRESLKSEKTFEVGTDSEDEGAPAPRPDIKIQEDMPPQKRSHVQENGPEQVASRITLPPVLPRTEPPPKKYRIVDPAPRCEVRGESLRFSSSCDLSVWVDIFYQDADGKEKLFQSREIKSGHWLDVDRGSGLLVLARVGDFYQSYRFDTDGAMSRDSRLGRSGR